MEYIEIVNELKKVIRRIEDQRRTIDSIHADRDLLEDILNRMTAIESALNLQRSHATETAKNIKADISDVKVVVQDKIEEVSEQIVQKPIKKKKSYGWLNKMFRTGGGKNARP